MQQGTNFTLTISDEQTAIQCLKRGDIGGLEFLVHRYQVKAVRTAYLVTRNPALAEEGVQDCFIQAYRAIGGFDALEGLDGSSRPCAAYWMTARPAARSGA